MTHAFFKALLFMAAGSLIGAMAGEQSLDRMGGFRKALPFTFACFVFGGLALSGMPPFSGWLSKDDILAFLDHRGGGFEVLGILGYVGALADRDLHVPDDLPRVLRRPVPEARELEHGHLPTPRCRATRRRRGGGHRRRLPRPGARHRRARAADEGRDGHCSRCSRRRRRRRPDPGRRRRGDTLPGADVRRLAARAHEV